ncbi:MAG: VWA domain-containing protein [Chthonomonadetes bacterium]|nr:VWA domain-containing protein [Chthonomonadetes bacterium]
MRFLAIWNLLWFLPIGGAILALYILRLRRRRVEVPALLLWAQVVQDFQANVPWQRLRKHWLLLVQLLAALLLVLGIAQPYTRAWMYSGEAHVLVLDGSASMLATDVSPSRFEQARAMAREYIQKMPPGDQAAIVLAGARPRVLCGLTTNRSELLRTLRNAQPAETGANIAEALALAGAMLTPFAAPTIEVFTDGGFPEPRDVDTGRARLQYHTVGERAENAGIVAVDLREHRDAPGRFDLFVVLRHNSERERRYTLELWRSDNLIDAQEVTLPARSEAPVLFRDLIPSDRPEELRVRLDSRDALACDNTAYAILYPVRELKVLLVSTGNLFLETALNLHPRTVVTKVASPPAEAHEKYDVVVYDGIKPASPPEGNAVIIGTLPAWFPVVALQPVENSVVVDWHHTHPTMRYVDLASVRLSKATPVLPKPGVETLVEVSEGAVMVSLQKPDRRWLLVTFDITSSDLPLRVAFPVMMLNALRWLTAPLESGERGLVPAGGLAVIPVPGEYQKIHLRLPDGRTAELNVQEQAAPFEDTLQTGIYRCTETGYQFAVNLVQREETDLAVNRYTSQPPSAAAPGTRKVLARREWWQWLAGLLLAVLALEWIMYHRRW